MSIIRGLKHKDRVEIETILRETQVFSEAEISVALELVDISLKNEQQKDYNFLCYVSETDELLGYTCYGKTPMTESTYDMYWIAVKPSAQNKGIGKFLLSEVEKIIKEEQGSLIVVETSSREDYLNTRMFYIKANYQELSRIKNYYKVNDDLVVYGKYL